MPELPGFPLIHSPIFPLLEAQGCFGEQQQAARFLHENGYLLIDLGRSRMASIARRVKQDLEDKFDLNTWRKNNGEGAPRLQDAWRISSAVAEIAVLPEITEQLARFWGREAFPFQTLNFPVGTSQHIHSDAVHFHSEPAGFMCGVWIALEDIANEAGPLVYYPGSHQLPYLQARDVGYVQQSGQTPDQSIFHHIWQAELDSKGLKAKYFTPKLGQALIWTANLIHGGSPVKDLSLTRWSQVTHYFFEDCNWYTPMLSDWPHGLVAWRQPLNIATGKEELNSTQTIHSVDLNISGLVNALILADLKRAELLLLKLLTWQPSHLEQILKEFRLHLEKSNQLDHLWPLLEGFQQTRPQLPALAIWRSILKPDTSPCSIDHLIDLGNGKYLAFGWCIPRANIEMLVRGRWGTYTLNPIANVRLNRPDVAATIGLETWQNSGFIVALQLPDGEPIAELWLQGNRIEKSAIAIGENAYPKLVDSLLKHCHVGQTPLERLPELMQEVLGKELLRLREPLQDQNHWSSYISMEQRYGSNAVAAEISIVVPLYRRWDFVLGQLAAFAMDNSFQNGKVKIIYVIDDPTIQADFLGWCAGQLQQENLAIEIIALKQNMGFAMACNIGIQYATTNLICLLNSDVLPSQPGWLLPLLETHQKNQTALIAPLLVYENGLIQHAGMEVHWSGTSDGLPVCIHPHKGLDLSQLSHIQATPTAYSTDALSGAALFFDRKTFLDLGGFDPAFGRGDFEDLEFSMRWKRRPAALLMVPSSKLIHLEGQSISRQPDLWASWRRGCNAWLAKELCPESKASGL